MSFSHSGDQDWFRPMTFLFWMFVWTTKKILTQDLSDMVRIEGKFSNFRLHVYELLILGVQILIFVHESAGFFGANFAYSRCKLQFLEAWISMYLHMTSIWIDCITLLLLLPSTFMLISTYTFGYNNSWSFCTGMCLSYPLKIAY